MTASSRKYLDAYLRPHVSFCVFLQYVGQKRGIRTLHVLRGVNTDSGRAVKTPKALTSFSSFEIDCSVLYDILVDCRLHKVS